jgi:hypothetical protein
VVVVAVAVAAVVAVAVAVAAVAVAVTVAVAVALVGLGVLLEHPLVLYPWSRLSAFVPSALVAACLSTRVRTLEGGVAGLATATHWSTHHHLHICLQFHRHRVRSGCPARLMHEHQVQWMGVRPSARVGQAMWAMSDRGIRRRTQPASAVVAVNAASGVSCALTSYGRLTWKAPSEGKASDFAASKAWGWVGL